MLLISTIISGCYIIPSPNTPARNAMKVYGEMEMSISQSIKDVVDLVGGGGLDGF